MRSALPDDPPTLVDELLAEQRQLTAVERFAQWHEPSAAPAQARYYQDLIPLEKPRPGEQYAFTVDLDACTGCKACVSACHSLNGLEEHETWRTTGLLHGGTVAEPYQQVVTTACHHCVDPACLNGCPVLAYDKDPLTGIVRHLDDQCIGCQYCVLKCPYDVPKYSTRLGIVRKCDMCHSRLAAGEAPACVQACPSSAIRIGLVSQQAMAQTCQAPGERLVPGAFASAYTLPTTRYTSRRPRPTNATPADAHALRLEKAHWPLIGMLLLTQLAAGLFAMTWTLGLIQPQTLVSAQLSLSFAGCLVLQIGLLSSVFHLGRPWGAWRAWLGWRRSWMSREILAFGGFAAAASTCVVANRWEVLGQFAPALSGATTLLGLLSVFCSAMVYVDTQRPFWQGSSTLPKFFGTALLLGASGCALVLGWLSLGGEAGLMAATRRAAWFALFVRTGLFVWEAQSFRCALGRVEHLNHRSAAVLWKLRRGLVRSRPLWFALSTLSGLLAIFSSGAVAAGWATASFLLTLTSQVIERYCFFVAVNSPKMPGGFSA